MTGLQRDREFSYERHDGRQCGNAQVRLSTSLETEDVLAHCAGVTNKAMRPKQDPLQRRPYLELSSSIGVPKSGCRKTVDSGRFYAKSSFDFIVRIGARDWPCSSIGAE